MFSCKFVGAGLDHTDYGHHVPAPYFRYSFEMPEPVEKATLTICGLGFYDLFFNGKRITKGLLAPYISNPDDIVYYDEYDITQLLTDQNTMGIHLGNGMQNGFDGSIWDFEKAKFRGAPRVAFAVEILYVSGYTQVLEADPALVRTAPSPVMWDGLRTGIGYDARLEIPNWNDPYFDDSDWAHAIPMETPRGEARLCTAEPVIPQQELKPIFIKACTMADFTPRGDVPKQTNPQMNPTREGYLYDFGYNTAGIIRMKIQGYPGQQIDLQFMEYINENGEPDYNNISFYPDGYCQRDIYICKGEGVETFIPQFTYHGFRYVVVQGLEEGQATPDLLTAFTCHSDLGVIGGFTSSDDTANQLMGMTLQSDLSNFYYFPTDCPHREKNGWTGDAAASAEHMLLTLSAGNSLKVWMDNICKAQRADGALPGIIPTGGWGFDWGNGPGWDCVISYLPYYVYTLTGDREILENSADAIFHYVDYISGHRTKRGTVELGLGDWLPVTVIKTPLEYTDSLMTMSILEKASFIFDVLGQTARKAFADDLRTSIRTAVRTYLVDLHTMTAIGRCQTGQAMGLYYGLFEPAEEAAAMQVLLDVIHEAGDHVDCGFLGMRVLFRALADHGEADLAYKMICRPDYPSYGNFVARGLTALPEDFRREEEEPNSLNHHFMGDIAAFFMEYVAGLRLNPTGRDLSEVDIRPNFIDILDDAAAYHDFAEGRVICGWNRTETGIELIVNAPEVFHGMITLPKGWIFSDSKTTYRAMEAGAYEVVQG